MYVCVVFQCLGQSIYSVPYMGINMVECDISEVIYYKDSSTGRTQVLRESLRILHTEGGFAGQPDFHLLSFWMVACQWFFPLYGSCF